MKMLNQIPQLVKQNKTTLLLIFALLFILGAGFFMFQKFIASSEAQVEEVDLIFDPEGPYALTVPRRDGNAMILNLKRTSSYDTISYELAYTSRTDETVVGGSPKPKVQTDDGLDSGSIDRGVVGSIDTKDKKGEYEQEILFGTCSKQVCKYDKGVENGTLTLHIRKGNQAYRMVTQWHLQKPDVALGVITSGDGHLKYETKADRQTLANVGFSIVNDLTGVPKLPSDREVLGKVYALNIPTAKELSGGTVSVELAENPGSDAKLYRFDGAKWEQLDTNMEGSRLSAQASGAGIFAVLIPHK